MSQISEEEEVERHAHLSCHGKQDRYHIQWVDARKGYGVFAAKYIAKECTIMQEKHSLFLSNNWNVVWDDLSNNVKLEMIKKQFDKLSSDDQECFLSLSGAQTQSSKLVSIFDTNCVEVFGRGLGIYFDASRINHSCVPNAWWLYNKKTQKREVIAFCEIEEGAEITVSYLGDEYPVFDARQLELNENWKFICQCDECAKCMKDGQYRQQSDKNFKLCNTFPVPNVQIAKAQLKVAHEVFHGQVHLIERAKAAIDRGNIDNDESMNIDLKTLHVRMSTMHVKKKEKKKWKNNKNNNKRIKNKRKRNKR